MDTAQAIVFTVLGLAVLGLLVNQIRGYGKTPEYRGSATCEFEGCTAPATRYAPIIRISGLSTDLTGHRTLSAQTPIYNVVADTFGGLRYCESHERVIKSDKERKLSSIRSRVSDLNASIEREIAELEGRNRQTVQP